MTRRQAAAGHARVLLGVALTLVPGTRAPAARQFAAGTELVEVYASVTDTRGNTVRGLPASAFTVLEDGVAQPISAFSSGDVPLTVAVVVDRSFSMGGEPFDAARAGARRLIDELSARDRLLVLAVGGGVERISGVDASRGAARAALDTLQVWGTSPIGDTMVQALQSVAGERGRRAVILFSDGVERESSRAADEVLDRVKASGVLIYPIATAKSISPLLTQLAEVSGGRVVRARQRDAAERAASSVAEELRHQYLLGYVPPPGKPGWRRIEVRAGRSDLRVRARQGYLAGPPHAADASS